MTALCAAWLLFFGVWPVAHPSHDLGSALSALDLSLHVIGAVWCWALMAAHLDPKSKAAS